MNLLPQFFYGMVVIDSLSMVGDGGGWEGVEMPRARGRPRGGGGGLRLNVEKLID